jgi:hypothetical protein
VATEQGEFSVFQFFPDESYECIRQFVSAEEAVKAFTTYTSNPASMIGITRRVIITDGGDFTVAEWKHGEGVVYPPKKEQPKNDPPRDMRS